MSEQYGPGEFDDLLAEAKRRGSKLQRNRRALIGGSLGAVVIVVLAAVFFTTRPTGTVLQVGGSPSGGSATPTGVTSPSPLQAGGATTQRRVAIHTALIRYELGAGGPTDVARGGRLCTPRSDCSRSPLTAPRLGR
ncbi:MAG: hypothetical protein ACRDJU_09345 [Actinomycetota bacterium]